MEGTSIFKLYGSILVDSSKAEQSIAKTSDKAETMGTKLGRGIKSAAKWGAAIGGAALLVGGAMMGAANKVASTADEIDKASRRAGTSSENWQKLKYAFGQSGIEANTLEKAMVKNQKALNEAASGGKKAKEAYEQLGVSIQKADGTLRDSDDVFQDTIKTLADMEDKNLRNAIANDIFGKSYADLAPILDSGADGIDELMTRADKLGLIMSQEAVDAGVKFGDTLSDVQQMGGMLFNEIAVYLIPILQDLMDWVIKHAPEIKRVIKNAFEIIGKVVKTAGKIFETLLPIIKPIWSFISWAFPRILQVTQDVFGAIKPIIDGVAGAFETVAGWIQKAYDKWEQWRNRKEDKFTDYTKLGGAGGGGQGGGGGGSWEASGIAYVPYDDYKVRLHKGERVLTRGEVANQNSGTNISITITGNTISSDYDVDRIGDRLAAKIQQENRRLANRTSLIPI